MTPRGSLVSGRAGANGREVERRIESRKDAQLKLLCLNKCRDYWEFSESFI